MHYSVALAAEGWLEVSYQMFSLKPQFTRVLDVPFNPHEGFHVIAFETVTWLTVWSICDSVQEEGGESKTKD